MIVFQSFMKSVNAESLMPDLIGLYSYTVSWKAKFGSWVFHETLYCGTFWAICGQKVNEVKRNVTLCR